MLSFIFFFQAEDGIRDYKVTGVQTCALPIYLFSETVGGNIAFGLPNYDLNQVRQAAEITSLDSDVEGFTNKYETVVGERGITLSGGQKQRTAIARAVIRD